ncbi:MAG: sulfatase-like hydrolase/transferase [Planctomycetes bacterium]|nr:sulfatase-like hydrolase/transferase [Planctomycetota bacterium]
MTRLRYATRALACLFAALILLLVPQAMTAAERPNIVFILADDLGWHDVPWHGSDFKMPALDELSKQSLKLEAHYVHPMCSPTRAALLSGRYASRYGVTGAQNERAFPFDTVTLPAALKTVGYTTAITGKWHLGSLPEWGPNKFGFDYAYGVLAGGVSPYDHRYKEGPYVNTLHRNGAPIDEKGHITDLFTREAIDFLERKHTAPFFLYVPFTAVHIPIDEEAKYIDQNSQISDPGRRMLAADCTHMDESVGKILATLDRTGQRLNTIVIFCSDNGGHSPHPNHGGYKGTFPELTIASSNTPLRGFKTELYEGGIRSPTLVTWPEHLQPGTITEPMHCSDWFATLAALVGYEAPSDLRWDGANLWPVLSGEVKALAEPRTLYNAGVRYREQCVRRGEWKLIVSAKGNVELFNLADDLSETKNVADQYPDVVSDLKQRLSEAAARDNESKVTGDVIPKS